jgi:uncharacterized membrane protein
MSRPAGDTNAESLERTVGRILRVGMTASSMCLGVGLAASLAGVAPRFASPLLTAGLIVLLATPASRVVASAVVYIRSRDWLFAALTLVVLFELALSIIAAMRAASL